jgi:hypothetical protein
MGCPVSDCTKTLHDESLVFDTRSNTYLIAVVLVAQQLTGAVVNTKTSGFSSATNTTLLDKLTCAAAFSVNVLFTLNVHVGIFDPGHNLLVCSHIWAEAIYSSTDETFLNQLHSVLSGNTLKLSF